MKQHLQAILSAICSFAFLLIFLNLMNASQSKKDEKAKDQVQFAVKKVKKKSPNIKKKRPKKTKKRSRAKSLKPKMNRAFANSGLDLGLDLLGLSAQDNDLLSQSGDGTMTEDVVDQLPRVQNRTPIPYPESAKEQNINGYVTVNILVGKEGDVENVKLIDSHPEGIFDQVAVNAIRDWTFSPAEYKGRFVNVWVKQKLKFQVN